MRHALRNPAIVLTLSATLAGGGLFLVPSERSLCFALAGVVLGLGLLIYGADWLVRGAVRLARTLGVSPFVIAVTVVAFGTSAPELAASIGATLKQEGEIAIGNVIGSNVANLLLILGVTGVIRLTRVPRSIVVVDTPILLGITCLASLALLDTVIFGPDVEPVVSRLDGALLTIGLVGFVAYNAITGKVDPAEVEEETSIDIRSSEERPTFRGVLINLGLILLGLAGLVGGAHLLVEGAQYTATRFNVPKEVIGLTVVAIGTSIPELAFSIRAAQHDHGELILGNVLGSNVFNLLCVLGLAALVDPIKIPEAAASRDIWFMIGTSFLIWIVFVLRRRLARPEGVALLLLYVAYTAVVLTPSR